MAVCKIEKIDFCDMPSFSNEDIRRRFPIFYKNRCLSSIYRNKSIEKVSKRISARLAYTLQNKKSMNIIDLLIIYFSVGAPFGVYTYIQRRAESKQNKKDLRPFFAFFFWLPCAARLIFESKFFNQSISLFASAKSLSLSDDKERLSLVEKNLEKCLAGQRSTISIYEFREIVERYAALTIAAREQIDDGDSENEFFRIAGNKNRRLAAKCFNRRNRRRLSFHQTSARKDFLDIAAVLLAEISDKRVFVRSATQFVEMLNDSKAQKALMEMSAKRLPEVESYADKQPEKVLWKPEIPEPSPNRNSI